MFITKTKRRLNGT